VAEADDLPARHDTERAVEPSHVPVRLHRVAHLVRHVRAVEPNGVDLEERAQDTRDRHGQAHESRRLGNKGGPQGRPDDVTGRVAASGELRMFLADEHPEVRAQQPHDDCGQDQHVEDEEPRDDRVTRKVTAEKEEGRVAADKRDRLDDRERDPETRSRDKVVRERIAEEAVEDCEDEKSRADDPVELAGLRNAPVKKMRSM